nr:hypothetical protein [Tanacetum cinerariifolium]
MRRLPLSPLSIALVAFTILGSCSSSATDTDVDKDAEEASGYADGTYCAQVDYYYPASGTNSTYTLLVDVDDNHLVKIHWPNGGWLDETHYSGPDIEDGDANFTSDQGVEYTVRIQGEEGSCSLDSNAIGENAVIQEHEDQRQASDTEEQERRQQAEQEEDEHRLQAQREKEEEEQQQAQEREELQLKVRSNGD